MVAARYCLILCLLLWCAVVEADESSSQQRLAAYTFTPGEYLRHYQQALVSADERPLLVVLGAEWCHDSRALADVFSTTAMHPWLVERFRIQFVDVGYLQSRARLLGEIGYPGYYGTPSVYALSADGQQLLNGDAIAFWHNAASHTVQDMQRELLKALDAPLGSVQNFSTLPAPVQAYFIEHTDKLQDGFDALSPLLRAAVEGEKPAQFDAAWKAVREYRGVLQQQLDKALGGDTQLPQEPAPLAL